MMIRFASLMLIVLFLLSGCSQVSPAFELTSPEATAIPTPEPGLAIVTGQIIDKNYDEPLNNTVVRLAEVFREGDEGAYVLNEAFSPGARTDINGIFVFANVDAREYVIVVGNVTDVYTIIKNDDGTPRIWNAVADEIMDVGILEVKIDQ